MEPTEPLRAAIDDYATAVDQLTEAVVAARLEGCTWTQIGELFGVTRQSAHATWHRTVNTIIEETQHSLSGTLSI